LRTWEREFWCNGPARSSDRVIEPLHLGSGFTQITESLVAQRLNS
jgi:hypothetical protein